MLLSCLKDKQKQFWGTLHSLKKKKTNEKNKAPRLGLSFSIWIFSPSQVKKCLCTKASASPKHCAGPFSSRCMKDLTQGGIRAEAVVPKRSLLLPQGAQGCQESSGGMQRGEGAVGLCVWLVAEPSILSYWFRSCMVVTDFLLKRTGVEERQCIKYCV